MTYIMGYVYIYIYYTYPNMIHDGMMDDGCVPKLLIAKNTILVAEFLS